MSLILAYLSVGFVDGLPDNVGGCQYGDKYSNIGAFFMKLDTLSNTPIKKPLKPIVEKKVLPEEEESFSFYGIDPSSNEHDAMSKEMRILKRADPDLYRRIMNLD